MIARFDKPENGVDRCALICIVAPGEKCARSSSTSALAIGDGSLSFAPFGAASFIAAAVIGGAAGDGASGPPATPARKTL
jgi:hypothetical protein